MKKLFATFIILIEFIAVPAWAYNAAHFYNLGLDSTLSNTKINYFTRAIELNPELSAAYEERGMIYYFQEHYTKMIRDFLKVIKLSPNNANGCAMLGVAYFEKNDYDSAVSYLTRAIELKPKLAEAYGYRAEVYRIKGMLDQQTDHRQGLFDTS